MTPSDNKPTVPDFFDEKPLDPVSLATGQPLPKKAVAKRKAGFYFSETLLARFNRCFHQLKLDGVPVQNKSMLAELALHHALDDLEKGEGSELIKALRRRR